MKSFVAIFALIGALSFWAGAAVAKPQELSCGTTSCSYENEEIGPHGTKTYHGHCDGSGNTTVTKDNSSMVCHKATGVTCTLAFWAGDKSDHYWTCTCTNDTGNRGYPTFDISCPAPS